MKLRIIAILCLLLLGAPAIWAQTWKTSLVVDNTVPCPGSHGGTFNPYSAQYPAIDGEWVVFIDSGDDNYCTANDAESIWSYNLVTKQLRNLVDTSTPVPEGTGDFEGFIPVCCTGNVSVRDGIVLFSGYDSGSRDNCTGGLYTVPVGGGTIYRVVDYTMKLPGYGGSFCFLNSDLNNGMLGATLDQGKIVFSAQATGAGLSANDGIWWAPVNVNTKESDLHRIADFDTVYQSPFPQGCKQPDCSTINSWSGSDIGGTTIAFASYSDSFGVGAAGLFLDKYDTPILLSDVVLPGDENTDPAHPYDYSYYDDPVMDGDNIFFIAFDPWYQGSCAGGTFMGVFEISTSTGSKPSSVMNSCDTQPNGDSLTANSFNQMAANEGSAVFQVTDNTTGASLLDASVNGVVSQLIAPGDPLPSGASCSGGYHAPGCVNTVMAPGIGGMNGGRVAFVASGGAYWYDEGIYVASLPCASAASVSVKPGTLTYDSKTGVWSETATATNSGKEAITGPLSLVLAKLTSGVTLANGNGSTVCFAPAGSPYVNLTLTDNELNSGKSVKVKLEFDGPADAEITFTSKVAGAGAR